MTFIVILSLGEYEFFARMKKTKTEAVCVCENQLDLVKSEYTGMSAPCQSVSILLFSGLGRVFF